LRRCNAPRRRRDCGATGSPSARARQDRRSSWRARAPAHGRCSTSHSSHCAAVRRVGVNGERSPSADVARRGQSRCRCGSGEPSPGAEVAAVSAVPAQM
jgi:hypothetical protein